ncbi:MAG: hypothetical protein PF545_00525, partial [Elusimicrobia bacterium]|nr:hypothetical protein [Elusimicrobiota bacterium]
MATALIGVYPFYSSAPLTVISLILIFIYAFNIEKKDLYVICDIVILSAGIVSLYGIFQYIGLDPLGWKGNFYPRIWSTLGNPNFLGAYIAMVLPVTIVKYFNDRKKITLTIFAISAAALLLTSSRGGLIAAVAGSA